MISATVNDISFDVPEENLNDWDILEAFMDLDENKSITSMGKVAKLFFGAAQWTRIKNELRDANGGRLPIEVALDFIMQAFTAISGNGESLKN